MKPARERSALGVQPREPDDEQRADDYFGEIDGPPGDVVKRAPHNQLRESHTEDERDRRRIQRDNARVPQRQRPSRDKRMSPAERSHSERHATTGQRQRANGKAVAQTNNGNHQAADDKADECSRKPRLLHPVERQDIGAPANRRTQRHGKDPRGLHRFPQCRILRHVVSLQTIHLERQDLADDPSARFWQA